MNILEHSNNLNHMLLYHETNYLVTVCYISLIVCKRLSTCVLNCSISIVSIPFRFPNCALRSSQCWCYDWWDIIKCILMLGIFTCIINFRVDIHFIFTALTFCIVRLSFDFSQISSISLIASSHGCGDNIGLGCGVVIFVTLTGCHVSFTWIKTGSPMFSFRSVLV